MCGTIAYRTRAAALDLLIALRRLVYRGYDSVGVAVQTTNGNVARLRTVKRIDALEREVHTDCTGRITLVHNGKIENTEWLRRNFLAAAGHRFTSSVDSQVLCHLIEDQLGLCAGLLDAVHARGGRVIGIGSAGSTVPVVSFPVAPWGPLESVVPLQVLPRTLALALGRDVDKPRNSAKSVTVE